MANTSGLKLAICSSSLLEGGGSGARACTRVVDATSMATSSWALEPFNPCAEACRFSSPSSHASPPAPAPPAGATGGPSKKNLSVESRSACASCGLRAGVASAGVPWRGGGCQLVREEGRDVSG